MRTLFITNILLILFVFIPSYAVAISQTKVTLLDGTGSLIRGTSRYDLKKGIELQQTDIIELNDRSFAQIEMVDGTTVAFGEKSLVMISSLSSGIRTMSELFIIRGVVKATSPNGAKQLQIDSPILKISLVDATAVMTVSPTEAEIFSEVGGVKLATGSSTLKIKGGEYCSINTGKKPSMLKRPPQAFITALPIQFRDALPKLLPKIGNHKVSLVKPRDFSYNEVEAWLDSKPSIRKLLVIQWKTKAHDPSFRKALIRNINKHPEWDRVLFPEKYTNKTPKTGP